MNDRYNKANQTNIPTMFAAICVHTISILYPSESGLGMAPCICSIVKALDKKLAKI